jgi:hypothetical protein
MRSAKVAPWLALMIVAGSLAAVRAADESPQTKGNEPPAAIGTAAEIDRLVAELDAPRYSERQSASEKLAALGAAAIPALEKAAKAESLEVATRAIELLKKLLDASEASTRTDARQALQRLAKSERPKAARLAEEALKAKEQEEAANSAQGINGRFGVNAIQIVVGNNARQVRVQNNNGKREISIDEGARKIKINDGAGQPIKIEVTTRKTTGKDSTEKYEAKDVEELKKKHPEAYKIYKDWENQRNPFGLQAGGGINVMGIGPAGAPFQPPPDQQVRTAIMVLQSLHRRVGSLIQGDQVQKASPQSKAELKQALDQLKQTLADVEKRLQEKPTTPAAKPDAGRGGNKPE